MAVWLLEAVADTDHSGLALTSVSFFDDSGEPLADGLDLELRAAGPSTTDFARASTGDFDGRLPAGVPVRLWVAARMPKAVADATRPTPLCDSHPDKPRSVLEETYQVIEVFVEGQRGLVAVCKPPVPGVRDLSCRTGHEFHGEHGLPGGSKFPEERPGVDSCGRLGFA